MRASRRGALGAEQEPKAERWKGKAAAPLRSIPRLQAFTNAPELLCAVFAEQKAQRAGPRIENERQLVGYPK